jgi:hypothetical protein
LTDFFAGDSVCDNHPYLCAFGKLLSFWAAGIATILLFIFLVYILAKGATSGNFFLSFVSQVLLLGMLVIYLLVTRR